MVVLYYILSIFVIINVIVLVHEYGHYIVARKNGVKVTKFSLGMGPELFGFNDKNGTRWCFSMLPIGGFVMMLGDEDATSATCDEEALQKMSEEERKQSYHTKTNWQKIWISFAGPFANYIYAFVVLVCMGCFYGLPTYDPVVGQVIADSPAEKYGILKGDRVISVDGKSVARYRDIIINIMESESNSISFVIDRNGELINIELTPEMKERKSVLGKVKKAKFVGIASSKPSFERKNIFESIVSAVKECVYSTKEMFHAFSRLFAGKKSLDDFGGIVRMAEVAGDLSKDGNFAMLIMFTVTLSLNLGFINLFPLPVLDGGNILMCLIEQITGRKLNQKMQEYIMIICAALLIVLMLATTVNDVLHLDCVNKFVSKIIR